MNSMAKSLSLLGLSSILTVACSNGLFDIIRSDITIPIPVVTGVERSNDIRDQRNFVSQRVPAPPTEPVDIILCIVIPGKSGRADLASARLRREGSLQPRLTR